MPIAGRFYEMDNYLYYGIPDIILRRKSGSIIIVATKVPWNDSELFECQLCWELYRSTGSMAYHLRHNHDEYFKTLDGLIL